MIIFKILTVLLISFIIAGCVAIWVPTQEQGDSSDVTEVGKDMEKQLEPGTTTKDDVILLLGEPERVYYAEAEGSSSPSSIRTSSEDFEKFICYYWIRKDGVWFAAGGGDVKWGSTEVEESFCLEFTPDGKLKRFKHFQYGWFKKAFKETFKNTYEQEWDWMAEEN